MNEVNHFRRVVLIWLVSSVIAHADRGARARPGDAAGRRHRCRPPARSTDNTVLLGLSTPVALAVARVLHLRADRVPRARHRGGRSTGRPMRGHAGVQLWWIVTTTTIVLFLAGYGTVRLLADGAGGGQGPNPIAKPTLSGAGRCQVQVIAQQWKFTFRFPAYGGVETPSSRAPGKPADRVPRDVAGRDPLVLGLPARRQGRRQPRASTTSPTSQTKSPLTFNIHCAELCGVWHGYMFDTGEVVSRAAVRLLDRPAAAAASRRPPSCCRRMPSSTSQTPRGRGG